MPQELNLDQELHDLWEASLTDAQRSERLKKLDAAAAAFRERRASSSSPRTDFYAEIAARTGVSVEAVEAEAEAYGF